jgi:Fe-S cluster assembly iron-binding protein IscA
MNKLFIDDKAIVFIKDELAKENASAIRIFTCGGGCCSRFQLAPVNKSLKDDVTRKKGGITVHIEKEIAENIDLIWIKFDKQKGLLIEFE